MSLETLRNRTRRNLGVRTDDPFHTDVRILGALNDGAQHISTIRDWPWLKARHTCTTRAGRTRYTLPSDFVRPRSLKVNNLRYAEVSDDALDDYDTVGDAGGVERVFSIDEGEGTFSIRPEPAAGLAVVLKYVRTERSLVNDDDRLRMPHRFDGVLTDYATSLCFAQAGNTAEADRWLATYERRLVDMKLDDGRSKGTPQVMIRPGWGL